MRHDVSPPQIRVRLIDGPIMLTLPDTFAGEAMDRATAGAVLTFEGRVRGIEATAPEMATPIVGLEYEVYEPMTSRELQRLSQHHAAKHGALAVDVQHSFGFVANGECSFVLRVATVHRAEAIRFIDEFIFEMKRHVPIWKVPRMADRH